MIYFINWDNALYIQGQLGGVFAAPQASSSLFNTNKNIWNFFTNTTGDAKLAFANFDNTNWDRLISTQLSWGESPIYYKIINNVASDSLTAQLWSASTISSSSPASISYTNTFDSRSGNDYIFNFVNNDENGREGIRFTQFDVTISCSLSITTDAPTTIPSSIPSSLPSSIPTDIPSNTPSNFPSNIPTGAPTQIPSQSPTYVPTGIPTNIPSGIPSGAPTTIPTVIPTPLPSTDDPTAAPSELQSSQTDNFESSTSTTNDGSISGSNNNRSGTAIGLFDVTGDIVFLTLLGILVLCLSFVFVLWYRRDGEKKQKLQGTKNLHQQHKNDEQSGKNMNEIGNIKSHPMMISADSTTLSYVHASPLTTSAGNESGGELDIQMHHDGDGDGDEDVDVEQLYENTNQGDNLDDAQDDYYDQDNELLYGGHKESEGRQLELETGNGIDGIDGVDGVDVDRDADNCDTDVDIDGVLPITAGGTTKDDSTDSEENTDDNVIVDYVAARSKANVDTNVNQDTIANDQQEGISSDFVAVNVKVAQGE